MKNFWIKVIILFSALGLVDAGYLTYKHYAGGVVPCSITHGCETVLASQYSEVFGIPISLFGMLFYAVIVILSVKLLENNSARIFNALLWLSGLGCIASSGLLYWRVFVIKAYCAYCIASEIITFGILIALLIYRNRDQVSPILSFPRKRESRLQR